MDDLTLALAYHEHWARTFTGSPADLREADLRKANLSKENNQQMNEQKRQGDVWFERAEAVPEGCRPVAREAGRLILARGEATGHAHTVAAPECALYEDASGTLWLVVPETAEPVEARHEEHAPVVLEPGTWRVSRQETWSQGFMRPVAD